MAPFICILKQPYPMEPKQCLQCGVNLNGRTDKKFCDDYCRTNFHNQKKSNHPSIREINRVLIRNRLILESLAFAKGIGTLISLRDLMNRGFRFGYFTNTRGTKNGGNYFFCYEYGYYKRSDKMIELIRQNDEMIL